MDRVVGLGERDKKRSVSAVDLPRAGSRCDHSHIQRHRDEGEGNESKRFILLSNDLR
jgi:hypothetical protein